MFETTKGFIENYIDVIEQMDWRALFDFFYADHLANKYCEEIVVTLKNAFPEQAQAIKAAQEYVFVENFNKALPPKFYYLQLNRILYKLPNFAGLQKRVIIKILTRNNHEIDTRDNIKYLVN